jgi:hypothetical protein
LAEKPFGRANGFARPDGIWFMKKIVPLLVCLPLLGCGEKSAAPQSGSQAPAAATNAGSSGSVLTAPVDYLAAAAKAQQNAVKVVDTTSLNKAIQMFNVSNGRNPKDLNELVEQKFIPKIPDTPYGTKLEYNADSGEVKVVKQ